MTEAAVRVSNLSKSFFEPGTSPFKKKNLISVLENVNFEVRKGQCYGFLGRNGSGKSTLLKMVAGVMFPTSGSIDINGRILPMLEVGTGFNPELTCVDNIHLYNALIGLDRHLPQSRMDEIIEFAEIVGHEKKPVKFLSTGMYMRLAFSVAVHQKPDIIIIDEVLAVGDPGFQRKCIDKVLSLKKETAIIFVSHNLAQMAEISDFGAVFHDKTIVKDGPISEVLKFYETEILGMPEGDAEKLFKR